MKKVFFVICMLIISSILIVPATSINNVSSTPDLRIKTIKGGIDLKINVKNYGDVDATDIKWSISFKGGRLLNAEKLGVIDSLAAGAEETIRLRIFGFGRSIINLTTEYSEGVSTDLNASVSVFMFFVKGSIAPRKVLLVYDENYEGVSPGYWKNHYKDPRNAWNATGYYPNQTVKDFFKRAWEYDLDGDNVLTALKYGGGNDTTAAARLLIRSGIAAILNSAHPLVNYTWPIPKIQFRVNRALNEGIREDMLWLKDTLDSWNNLGCEEKLY